MEACWRCTFLTKGQIRRGQKVLIYGAFGGRHLRRAARQAFWRGSGRGLQLQQFWIRVVPRSRCCKEDFTKKGHVYDLVFIAVGNRRHPPSREECKLTLAEDGAYVSVDRGRPKLPIENLLLLKQLAETEKLKPVIDRSYPLEQIVEAHRYVDTGHKKGNVVITVA